MTTCIFRVGTGVPLSTTSLMSGSQGTKLFPSKLGWMELRPAPKNRFLSPLLTVIVSTIDYVFGPHHLGPVSGEHILFVASCFSTFGPFIVIVSDTHVSQFCFASWTVKL
ncbi:hypothetical protein E2I00_005428 [Balaenoptera physalus]|uniref:Uncharacterized protein n=1 Tax=Balaenoptera physalus TaxID=9770 RepID=A0A643CI11_BALPH|nr:hypothetical protein E2I00_005428 [Balaenoptera physalus]